MRKTAIKSFQDMVGTDVIVDLLAEFRDYEKVKDPEKILGDSTITKNYLNLQFEPYFATNKAK
jgi:hypothetical protein